MGKVIRYLGSMLPMSLEFRAWLYRISGVDVGSDVAMDRGVHLTAASHIHIGDRVTISTGVSILADVTAVHSRLEEEFSVKKTKDVFIHDDAYLGVKSTILPGVTVGRMATVGANTLVTADVPPYGVVIGVPGRVIMIRKSSD